MIYLVVGIFCGNEMFSVGFTTIELATDFVYRRFPKYCFYVNVKYDETIYSRSMGDSNDFITIRRLTIHSDLNSVCMDSASA